MFDPLRAHAAVFGPDWPALETLQRLLDGGGALVRNADGLPLRLVPPARRTGAPEDSYEARVFLRGELEVRERNWHDLMNVLVWRIFPAAKAALNARHFAEQRRQGPGNRGPAQDALTLFDEGGIVIVSGDDGLLDLLRAFRWKELFWRRRDEVRSCMRFFVFGHALYEKALVPFTGITARAILLRGRIRMNDTAPDVGEYDGTCPPISLPVLTARECEPDTRPPGLLPGLDGRVASRIENPETFSRTRDLAPVPVLGVPGWCAENEREEYYDNPDYFRPGRRGSSR